MTHPTAGLSDKLYRFGPFVLDPVLGRLQVDDEEVPLTRKTFAVLTVLVERHGQVVHKDDLLALVWPGTFVEENNLARCISMLRKALRDRDGSREYVLTVAGQGYQFAADVQPIGRFEPQPGAVVAGETAAPPTVQRWTWWPMAVAASVLVVGTSILVTLRSDDAVGEIPERRLWQVTSMARLEVEPAWSPDGRFLAYSSNRNGNPDIWVQPIDGGTPIQVTASDYAEEQPAWSPDGRLIAFKSSRLDGRLYVIPAFGGSPRRVSAFGDTPQWSPDGSRLLFYRSRRPHVTGAFVVGLDGADPKEVLAGVLAEFNYFRLAWHPDGQRVSILGARRDSGVGLWTMALDGSQQTQSELGVDALRYLTEVKPRLGDFVWGPGGRMLFFEGQIGASHNLWRVDVDPDTMAWIGRPTRLTTSTNVESEVAVSPDGTRVAFSSRVERTQGWSFPFSPSKGRLGGPGQPVTSDGSNTTVLDVTGDGRRLAYSTKRHGKHELWIRSLVDHHEKLAAVEDRSLILQPRWSSDGTQLAYLRRDPQASIVLVNALVGGERVIKTPGATSVYDWTQDGTAILLACRKADLPRAVCRLDITGGGSAELEMLAADPQRDLYQARLSPDGQWMSFVASSGGGRATVYMSSATGDEWIPVTEGESYDDKPRWAPDGSHLYFLSDRSGTLHLWARRIDRRTGLPVGEIFQVTRFDTGDLAIPNQLASLQIALTVDQLILPIRESAGSVWIMEGVAR